MTVKKRVLKKSKTLGSVDSSLDVSSDSTSMNNDLSSPKKSKLIYVIIFIIALGLLFLTNKGLLLAAVVDGKPIFREDGKVLKSDQFRPADIDAVLNQ